MKRLLFAGVLVLVTSTQAQAGWRLTVNTVKIRQMVVADTKEDYDAYAQGKISLQELELRVARKHGEKIGRMIGRELGAKAPIPGGSSVGEEIGEEVGKKAAESAVQAVHDSFFLAVGDAFREQMKSEGVHVWVENSLVGSIGEMFDPREESQWMDVHFERINKEMFNLLEKHEKELAIFYRFYGKDNVAVEWGLLNMVH